LLGDGTQDHDPHPLLFDGALQTLRDLNAPLANVPALTMRFELAWLNELGYRPRLDACAVCGAVDWLKSAERFVISALAGGLLCPACEAGQRDKRPISAAALMKLREFGQGGPENSGEIAPMLHAELRQLLGQLVSFVLGRRPRLLAYLE
jgi:DNA repair protein RecO (recombination protein O)